MHTQTSPCTYSRKTIILINLKCSLNFLLTVQHFNNFELVEKVLIKILLEIGVLTPFVAKTQTSRPNNQFLFQRILVFQMILLLCVRCIHDTVCYTNSTFFFVFFVIQVFIQKYLYSHYHVSGYTVDEGILCTGQLIFKTALYNTLNIVLTENFMCNKIRTQNLVFIQVNTKLSKQKMR